MLFSKFSAGFQSLPSLLTSKLGLSGTDFLSGWFYVCSRTLWVSPVNSPVRLGVSPTTAMPTGFYGQRFLGFISLHWNPGLCGLSHSPFVSPNLSTHKCGTTQSASHCLALCPLLPGCLSLPFLPV